MRTMLVFPHRGDPPAVPDGYKAEPGDPYVLHMLWVPCKYRGVLQDCGGCPSRRPGTGPPYCELKDIIVDQNTCNACSEEPKT